jgi:hypothetical protein
MKHEHSRKTKKKVQKPKYKQKMRPLPDDGFSVPKWDWVRWRFPGASIDQFLVDTIWNKIGIGLNYATQREREALESKELGLYFQADQGGITLDFQGRFWLLCKNEKVAKSQMMRIVSEINKLYGTIGHLTRADACRDFRLPSVNDVLPLPKIVNRIGGDDAYYWSFLKLKFDNITHSTPFNKWEEIWVRKRERVLRIYNKTEEIYSKCDSPIVLEAYQDLWGKSKRSEEIDPVIRVEVSLGGKNRLADITKGFYQGTAEPKEALILWASTNGIYRWVGKGKKDVSAKTKRNHWELCPRFREVFLTFGSRRKRKELKKLPSLIEPPANLNRRMASFADTCIEQGLCLKEAIDLLVTKGFPEAISRRAELNAARDLMPSFLGWTSRCEDRIAVEAEAKRGHCNHPQRFPIKARFPANKRGTLKEYFKLYPEELPELNAARVAAINDPLSDKLRQNLVKAHLDKLKIMERLSETRFLTSSNGKKRVNGEVIEEDLGSI